MDQEPPFSKRYNIVPRSPVDQFYSLAGFRIVEDHLLVCGHYYYYHYYRYTLFFCYQEFWTAICSQSSALKIFSPSTMNIPYGELLPFKILISRALLDILFTMSAFSEDNGQMIFTSPPFLDASIR